MDIYRVIQVAGPFAILPALDWLMHKISGAIAHSIEPLIPEGKIKTALFREDKPASNPRDGEDGASRNTLCKIK